MATELRVGVIDSGCSLQQTAWVLSARRFRLDGEALVEGAAVPDVLGHGTAVLDTLAGAAPLPQFCVAQVFSESWQCSPLQIAAAVHWLIEQRVALINLSLGLRSDRPVLRAACAAAREAGILLCASSPAQGEPVFPASYPEVLRITGDARCAPGQWSWLNSPQADFGASVAAANGVAGASIACAALSGLIVDFLRCQPGADHAAVLAWLRGGATFVGPERRGAAHD